MFVSNFSRQGKGLGQVCVFPGSGYTGFSMSPVNSRHRKAKLRKFSTQPSAKSHRPKVLQVPALAKLPWLIHGFSTVQAGVSHLDDAKVLNLGFTEWDSVENVRENRRRFRAALGAAEMPLLTLKQFHSDVVHLFSSAPDDPCRGDAAVTNRPGLLLAVQTADCVPILLVDSKKWVIGAVHAGWRGTLARIVTKTIGAMRMHFGSDPRDLLAAIGPCIGPCCYEVGTEVATQFLSQFEDASGYFDELRTGDEPNPLQWLNMCPPGHQPPLRSVILDLRKANQSQLVGAGLDSRNIHAIDLCTACRPDLLFSYRKQGPQTGRLMSAIALKP
jgi:polyphenol oxidase